MSKSKGPEPSMYRCRELAALLAVLMIGGTLAYTVMSGGQIEANTQAFIAFGSAIGLIILGYGGGVILDRMSKRYPFLTRSYHSALMFLLLPALIVFLGFVAWNRRDTLIDFADRKTDGIRATMHEFVTGEPRPAAPPQQNHETRITMQGDE